MAGSACPVDMGRRVLRSGGAAAVFQHAADEAPLDELGRCTACGAAPAPRDTLVAPGSGLPAPSSDDDVVTVALAHPHLLLTPVR